MCKDFNRQTRSNSYDNVPSKLGNKGMDMSSSYRRRVFVDDKEVCNNIDEWKACSRQDCNFLYVFKM